MIISESIEQKVAAQLPNYTSEHYVATNKNPNRSSQVTAFVSCLLATAAGYF